MFGSGKWKSMYEQAAKERDQYKKLWNNAESDKNLYKDSYHKMQVSFNRIHPLFGEYEYVEMALDIFKKYCKNYGSSGKIDDGRPYYWYYPNESSQGMKVVPTKELPDGYMRYVQMYEEPNDICVHCGKNFVLIDGYPKKNARFCDERCFDNHIWKQERLKKGQEEDRNGGQN